VKLKILTLGTLYLITKHFENIVNFDFEPKLVDVISYIIDKYPELKNHIMNNGKLLDNLSILVNGREYRYIDEGLNLKLKDGDVIAIVPPAGGGKFV
jgi:molybdopterin synthase sulfur carrier subunit